MNPEIGNYVKLVFNNNGIAEGFVVSWSDEKSVLESPSGDSLFIIQKTKDSVLAVKIMRAEPPRNQAEDLRYKVKNLSDDEDDININNVEAEFVSLSAKPQKTKNDLLKLAELKNLLNQQEMKDMSEQISSFDLSQNLRPTYAIPNIRPKPDFIERTVQKGARKNFPGFGSVPHLQRHKDQDD